MGNLRPMSTHACGAFKEARCCQWKNDLQPKQLSFGAATCMLCAAIMVAEFSRVWWTLNRESKVRVVGEESYSVKMGDPDPMRSNSLS